MLCRDGQPLVPVSVCLTVGQRGRGTKQMIYPATPSPHSLHLAAISSDSLGFAGQTSQGWRQTLETVPTNLDQTGDGDGSGGYISGNVGICGDNEAIRTR